MKLAFELEVPDGTVNEDMKKELLHALNELTVLKLYAAQQITLGQAAESLGLTHIQFLDLLRKSGIGFQVDLDEEDFRLLRQWRKEHLPKNAQ